MLPMATRVPIQSAQKPYVAFPLPYAGFQVPINRKGGKR